MLPLILLLSTILSKQNAVILILCRNEELDAINSTLKNFIERFNKKFEYPYVFLNDKEFTEEFKAKISETTNNKSTFGLVDPKDWNMPGSIDRTKAEKGWDAMAKKGVPYARVESYHNMCRFFSRTFYKHPLVSSYDYYWRIEPGVRFRCDIEEDPFDYMESNNKMYGFTIILHEFMESIPTLLKTTANFIEKSYSEIPSVDGLSFMYTHQKPLEFGKYNGCHFWSNFEIASFKFFRSKLYNDYVDALEDSGGFYYERWGDAPVHSVAVSFLLDKSRVHFFSNIGYTHDFATHCPSNGKNCDCTAKDNVDFTGYSCLSDYLRG